MKDEGNYPPWDYLCSSQFREPAILRPRRWSRTSLERTVISYCVLIGIGFGDGLNNLLGG
jgi:hypothetical protein